MSRPMPHLVDPPDVAAALGGDPDAVDAVVETWMPAVFRWCARLGGGRIDSEEAAQEVLLTFVRRRHRITNPDRLGAWFFGTCRRVVANRRRLAWWRRWSTGEGVDDHVAPDRTDAALERKQLADQVHRVLDRLPEHHRSVLVLCHLEERTTAEASALLGVPEGTVKSRLHHARARFHSLFERQAHG